MKRKLSLIAFILVAFISAFAQKSNPFNIRCDEHGGMMNKTGQKFFSGVCYDVYKHTYWDAKERKNKVHEMTIKCAE